MASIQHKLLIQSAILATIDTCIYHMYKPNIPTILLILFISVLPLGYTIIKHHGLPRDWEPKE